MLISEIGFGGILRKVKLESCTIVIDEDRKIVFTPEDFQKIFRVQCGNREVRGRDAQVSYDEVEFIRQN